MMMNNEISKYEAAWKALWVMIKQKKKWRTKDLAAQLIFVEKTYQVGDVGELLKPFTMELPTESKRKDVR